MEKKGGSKIKRMGNKEDRKTRIEKERIVKKRIEKEVKKGD